MRLFHAGSLLSLFITVLLSACGALQTELAPAAPRAGLWSLEYTGGCAGREALRLQITQLDETAIVFDDFTLLRDDSGAYIGSATFFAPMPADGRDIPYEISYELRAAGPSSFAGTETIVEGGGHGLDCPVVFVFAGRR